MKLYLVTYGLSQDVMHVVADSMAAIEKQWTDGIIGDIEEIKLVDDTVLILGKE